MRKRYVLLKDTPELKKGAIVEERCDDGTQEYVCITPKEHQIFEDQTKTMFTRKTVMENPDWFEEVIPLYIPVKFHEKVKKILGIK